MMSMRSWFIAATAFIVAGALMFTGAMTAYGWDFSKLSNEEFETRVCDIEDDFLCISVDSDFSDVAFVRSDDGFCRVVYDESERIKYSILVYDGILTIESEDRPWYTYLGFFFKTPKMTVYLPDEEYDALYVDGSSGDVFVSGDLRFGSIDISMSAGDVDIRSSVSSTVSVDVSTGEICVRNMSVGSLELSASSGDISVSDVNSVNNIEIEVNTGDVELERVIVGGKLSIDTGTGDIEMEYSDASMIELSTNTGDVEVRLLSGKTFYADTNTGTVRVPSQSTGGICRIYTNTGDITVTVV